MTTATFTMALVIALIVAIIVSLRYALARFYTFEARFEELYETVRKSAHRGEYSRIEGVESVTFVPPTEYAIPKTAQDEIYDELKRRDEES